MTVQPHLTVLIGVIVVGAAAPHAVWNAMVKHIGDRLVVFALIGVAFTMGGGLTVAVAGLPGRAAAGSSRSGRPASSSRRSSGCCS